MRWEGYVARVEHRRGVYGVWFAVHPLSKALYSDALLQNTWQFSFYMFWPLSATFNEVFDKEKYKNG
jgi:hypothetical protein